MASHTDLFTAVVDAELNAWVPNASQRLLHRAGIVMGFRQPDPDHALSEDCGPARGDHSLFADWAGHRYVLRCAGCVRIFKE